MNDYFDFALSLADAARKITLSYFRQPLGQDLKADNSLVTRADRETEALLRQLISKRYPEHSILGEEFGLLDQNSDYQWIIDPIDGTKNFVVGIPLYGTLIGLLKNQQPILGVVDIPAQNERWSCQAGQKTLYNAKLLDRKPYMPLSQSRLCSSDHRMFTSAEHAQIAPLLANCKVVQYNGDCYLYGLLASSLIEVVLESDLKPHDFLALIPVIEGAGGKITDWKGRALTPESSGQVLACHHPDLHAEILALLSNPHLH